MKSRRIYFVGNLALMRRMINAHEVGKPGRRNCLKDRRGGGDNIKMYTKE
jgi:hypothetical protein